MRWRANLSNAKWFLQRRQMMSNLLDIDEAAQKISVKSRRGATLLLDFEAAFPSMDHGFIWDTLKAVGIPIEFINAIRLFYKGNTHLLRLHGSLFDGPTVYCGERQGCPPLRFAIRNLRRRHTCVFGGRSLWPRRGRKNVC